jgi:hypothetical protein
MEVRIESETEEQLCPEAYLHESFRVIAGLPFSDEYSKRNY